MSREPKFVPLAVFLGVTAGVAGCDNADNALQVRGYEGREQCVASGVYTAGFCAEAYGQALARHQSSAPRFETREDCERDFGKDGCEERRAPSSSGAGRGTGYVPFMKGFVAGTDPAGIQSVAPVYRSAAGENLTDGGARIPSSSFGRSAAPARVPGVSLAKPSAVEPVSRGASFTSSSSRGGFGSTGRSAAPAASARPSVSIPSVGG